MTTSTQTRRTGLALNLRATSYLLRVTLLLAALAVTIAVFNGDGYVALALAISAGALFATGIAPGLIPAGVHAAAQTPFLLGFLIPLWALGETLLSGSAGLPDAVRALALYGGAVLILFTLPRYMRGPFLYWLPEGAIPPEDELPGEDDTPAGGAGLRGRFARRHKANKPAASESAATVDTTAADAAAPSSEDNPSSADHPAAPAAKSAPRRRMRLPRPRLGRHSKPAPAGTD